MQGPSPVQAPHPPQIPSVHVRDCVPHWPHDCVPGPVHDIATPPGLVVMGCGGTEDHEPQTGIDSPCVPHAVPSTIDAPSELALVQADGGSCSSLPLSVQPVNDTQQSLTPHTPVPPTGNCSPTLTLDGSVPAGSVTTQLAGSTAAAVADAKQAATSKQPAAAPASDPRSTPAPPSLCNAPAGTVGTCDGGTTDVMHEPCTHVCPPGHVELTPPSASASAVPTHR